MSTLSANMDVDIQRLSLVEVESEAGRVQLTSIVSAPSDSTQRPCLYPWWLLFSQGKPVRVASSLTEEPQRAEQGIRRVDQVVSCDVDEPLKLTEEPLYRRRMPTPGPSKQATLASTMAISGSL